MDFADEYAKNGYKCIKLPPGGLKLGKYFMLGRDIVNAEPKVAMPTVTKGIWWEPGQFVMPPDNFAGLTAYENEWFWWLLFKYVNCLDVLTVETDGLAWFCRKLNINYKVSNRRVKFIEGYPQFELLTTKREISDKRADFNRVFSIHLGTTKAKL
jgi:hypothetical protein